MVLGGLTICSISSNVYTGCGHVGSACVYWDSSLSFSSPGGWARPAAVVANAEARLQETGAYACLSNTVHAGRRCAVASREQTALVVEVDSMVSVCVVCRCRVSVFWRFPGRSWVRTGGDVFIQQISAYATTTTTAHTRRFGRGQSPERALTRQEQSPRQDDRAPSRKEQTSIGRSRKFDFFFLP